ncbi:MAG: IS1 family transposase ISCysp1 [Chroococcopsis gigantea SAG 12.99]|jgi:insertion element IS1 protein InsB|nr:IS1 family transposase ISCysp1 [Chroococcopsis gigantea SAG 12.99]
MVKIRIRFIIIELQRQKVSRIIMTKPSSETQSKPNRPPCPYCESNLILKNGTTHHKKPKFLCKSCGRQFIENPQKKYRTEPDINFINKLLLERISLRGIARIMGMSLRTLQDYVNRFYRSIPSQLKLKAVSSVNLLIECDELWSFVNNKENPVYIWLALDRSTRLIVGVYLGDRSRKSAEELWKSLPVEYQNNAQVYTDFWQSYCEVIPTEQHHRCRKSEGQTNHIERFNNTLRQRCSRLVRKCLSFSKNYFNHEGAIFYFIHHYNELILSKTT